MTQIPEPEFYVGYLDPAPPRLGRRLRFLAVTSLVVSLGAAVAVAVGQRRLPDAVFEYGRAEDHRGYLVADPFPALLVQEGGGLVRFHLVAEGKRGADALTAPHVNRWVALTGTRIRREGQQMLEVVGGSVVPSSEQPAPPVLDAIEDLGTRYLEGEVVEGKCYLGVMNPGSGIAHRACARLCMRGGIPPMLSVTSSDGATMGLLMVDRDGAPLGNALLELAAAPVGVTGQVVRVGDTYYIHTDPLNIRRLE